MATESSGSSLRFFSLQFLIKNNKENATESSGSSLRLLSLQFLMKNNKEHATESSVIVNECSGKALLGTPPPSQKI